MLLFNTAKFVAIVTVALTVPTRIVVALQWTISMPTANATLPDDADVAVAVSGKADVAEILITDVAWNVAESKWEPQSQVYGSTNMTGEWSGTIEKPMGGWFRTVPQHQHKLKCFGGGITTGEQPWLAIDGA